MRDSLLSGQSPLSGENSRELGTHLAACPACRELVAGGSALGTALAGAANGQAAPSADLTTAVARELDEDRGWRGRLLALSTRRRAALAIALGAFVVALQQDRAGAAQTRIVGMALLAVTLFALVLVLLEPLGRARHAGQRGVLVGFGLVFPALLALGWFGARAGAPSWGSAAGAFSCFGYGALMSAPFLALLFFLERRKRMPLFEAVMAGAASGLVANLALELHCANAHPAHFMFGHASLSLLWIAGAAGFVRRRAG